MKYDTWAKQREIELAEIKAKHPEIPCRACGTLDDLDGNAHKGERGELCFTCCERFAESDDWTGNYWDYLT
tara:strand:+ start:1632 stop:1844 length:213 start_codon:yes stop_codon:yes gene_type:complete